jgi:hypothetical protein
MLVPNSKPSIQHQAMHHRRWVDERHRSTGNDDDEVKQNLGRAI